MNNLIKSINDYKKWKNSLKKVLDDNFKEIAELIIDAYGENRFISTQVDRSQFQPIVRSGVVINVDQSNGDYLVWFYHHNSFFLLEKGRDSGRINIFPTYMQDETYPWLNNMIPSHRARFDNEIDFILMILEWAEDLVEVLKERMKRVNPVQLEKVVKELVSSVQ